MTYASALDPYPMWVNGYFCLDGSEDKLARKSVDPGNPKSTPDSREAAAAEAIGKNTTGPTTPANPTAVTRPTIDPERVNAAQKAAEAKQEPVSGYTPNGTTSTTPPPAGQVYSVKA